MLYAPNKKELQAERRTPQDLTDADLNMLYQFTSSVLWQKGLYDLLERFEKMAGVPAQADTNRLIADAIRASYAKLPRSDKKYFLELCLEAHNQYIFLGNGKSKRIAQAAN